MKQILALLSLMILFSFSSPLWAKIPSQFESDYSEAVLAFNAQNYAKTIKVLDALVKQSPETLEFLELKALTLKAQKNEPAAEKAYQDLISRQKNVTNIKPENFAPYYFELGAIQFRKKNYTEAKKYLEQVAETDFNPSVTHYYLGLMAFQSSNYSNAETHFNKVLRTDADSIKPIALLYLAQVYLKTGYPSGATYSFIQAKDFSHTLKENKDSTEDTKKVAATIEEVATKALAPFDKNTFVGNIALLGGYDSNVLSQSESALSSSGATGVATSKAITQGTALFMTSPLRTLQWIPNYRFSYNYNFDRETQSAEYLSQGLGLYLNLKPLARFTSGLKIDGNLIFQNDYDSLTGTTGTQRIYSLSGGATPFIKYDLVRRVQLGLEGSYSYQKVYTDSSDDPTNRYSGTVLLGRAFISWERGDLFLNPTLTGSYTLNKTLGSENKNNALDFGFGNNFYLPWELRLGANASYTQTRYPESTDDRSDKTLEWGLSFSKKLSKLFSILGSYKNTTNTSNLDDLYSYKKWTADAGVSLTF